MATRPITLIVTTPMSVSDGSNMTPQTTTVNIPRLELAPGEYEMEVVKNPFQDHGDHTLSMPPWLVVKGTMHGSAVNWLVHSKSAKEHCSITGLPKALREKQPRWQPKRTRKKSSKGDTPSVAVA